MSLCLTHRRPDRADVERIASEEGARLGLDAAAVLGVARPQAHVQARKAAIRRILAETGCSINGLSVVWGCDRTAIQRAVKNPFESSVKLLLSA